MLDLGFAAANLYSAYRLDVTFGLRDGGQRSGSGSGFVVVRADDVPFLATARHVVEPRLAIPSHVGATLLRIRMTGWNYAPALADQAVVDVTLKPEVVVPQDDALDIAIVPLSASDEANGCEIRQWIGEPVVAEEAEFGPDIRVGDFLASPGFTELPGTALERPVLLTGLIASDPRAPMTITRSGNAVTRAVLYQSLSRSGLSGAPVFATQRGLQLGGGLSGPPHRPTRLVGVNTGSFRDSQERPLQFSYFTRSSDLLELIRRA
ncbi:MAG: trypsin-like peptidase domain-containing protein [Sporichthyaceae bacterium]